MDQLDEWVSQEFQNLAEVLADYDSSLALEMIPKKYWADLHDKTKIFRVVDTQRNSVVMTFSSITSPQEILGEIWSRDLNKNDVIGRMDKQNAAAEALKLRKNLDELEAQKDFALFVIGNKKSRWVHGGRVKDDEFRDLGPVRKYIK